MKPNSSPANLKTLLVDDESLARKGLRLRLEKMQGIDIVGESANGREAVEHIAQLAPDLVFLDIQMPGLSGFDVIAELQQETLPLIVFVTAFDHYAVDAFNVHAVDYVLKPIDDDRLREAVARVREQLQLRSVVTDKQRLLELVISLSDRSDAFVGDDLRPASNTYAEKLAIRDGTETTLVPVQSIEWIDAAGDYMCVHAEQKTHILRATMKELESRLNPVTFLRVHRSTIVNRDCVTKILTHTNGEYHLVLDGGARLKMSRTYKEKVKHLVQAKTRP